MTEVRGNVIVGQSGGPTAVINSSLAGVFKTAKDRGARKVYGMLHGIQGLLQERYVDLEEHIKSDLDIELLKRTPSAYLGSCRFKLPEICDDREIYDKIFSILDKLEGEDQRLLKKGEEVQRLLSSRIDSQDRRLNQCENRLSLLEQKKGEFYED